MWFRIFFICFVLSSAETFAQQPDDETTTVSYHKIKYFGFGLATNGYSGHYRYGKHITAKKKRLYEAEFTTFRHPKEARRASSSPTTRSYVFGKVNYAYNVRLGIGQHKILAYKPLNGGVEIKRIVTIGVSNLILKPIYYFVSVPNERIAVQEKFNEEEHSVANIIGEGQYFNGFNEISYMPGIYGKFALNFEYAAERTKIQSLETGVILDTFVAKPEIMAFGENPQLFLSFYVALQFGNKKYR
jgi:hypothetical protein